jgi:fused signal recognition particle receptor
VVAIWQAMQLPVKYVGVGEQPEDLIRFDAESFVDALFEGLAV